MAVVTQWYDEPRLAGLDLNDSWLLGFVFEPDHSLRLFCEFHLTKEHLKYEPKREGEFASYKSGSILFRKCKGVGFRSGSPVSQDIESFDCGELEVFEIHEDQIKIEADSLKFEIHTTEFEVVIGEAI